MSFYNKTLKSLSLAILPSLAILGSPVVSAKDTLPSINPWLNQDAAQYAKDYNVSIAEAKDRINAQLGIGELQSILAVEEEDSFGGMYISHEPFEVVVLQKGNLSNKNRLSQISTKNWSNAIRYQSVQNSLKELEQAQIAAKAWSIKAGLTINSDINIKENRLELYVLDRHHAMNIVRATQKAPENTNIRPSKGFDEQATLLIGSLKNSVNASIIEVKALASNEADIHAGVHLSKCTSGFSVKNSNGTKGILTAGHCDNALSYEGNSLSYQSGQFQGSVDAQWHTTSDYFVTNVYRSCEYNRSICFREVTGVVLRANQVRGSYVCKYGKTTGYTCGTILSTSYDPYSDSNNTFVRVQQAGVNLSEPGDSGGPWFSAGKAYGIHSCGIGSGACYMPIDYISNLGVTVITE